MNILHWMKRVCSACGQAKPLDEFGKDRRQSDGCKAKCRACEKAYMLAWQRANKESVNARQARFYRTSRGAEVKRINNAKRVDRARAWQQTDHAKRLNRDAKRREYQRRRDVILARCKASRHKYRDVILARVRRPENRLHSSVSRSVRQALGKAKNGYKWETLVGYTRADLMSHLERQFKHGMTWENYGQWEIDHIRPRASFAFTTAEDAQFKECWALINLQPLWMVENRQKSARWVAA